MLETKQENVARETKVYKTKKLASPGFEPETFSVLDWRDNQLHHENYNALGFPYVFYIWYII